MENRINMESNAVSKEEQVNMLLKNYKREERDNNPDDFSHVKLKDCPMEVIWNTFSRSNWKLPLP